MTVVRGFKDSPEVLARFESGLPWVTRIAHGLRHQLSWRLPMDELVAYGREGLLSAARTFDPSRGVPFRHWAAIRIRGAMLDGLRTMGKLPRRLYRHLRALEAADDVHDALLEQGAARTPTNAASSDAVLSEYLANLATAMALGLVRKERPDPASGAPGGQSPEDQVMQCELLGAARDAITRLPPTERTLLERFYFQGWTLDEASRSVGLSKSWGSRLHARAIRAVTRDLRRRRMLGE